MIFLTILTLYFGNIQHIRASTAIVKGIVSPLEKSIAAFQEAIKISPISSFEAPEQFSKKMTGLIDDPKQNKELLTNGMELSAEELKKVIEKGLPDFRLYLFLGRHYNDFYRFNEDQEKTKEAEKYLEKAIELSPRKLQGYWSLAQTRVYQGRLEESVELLQEAIDINPEVPMAQWYLAMSYRLMGKNELALEKVKDAQKAGPDWKNVSIVELQKMIQIYEELKDDENLIYLYGLAIELDPTDARYWIGSAVAHANLGQFEKARELANKALELNPSFASEIEEFLNQLPE